MSNTEIEELIYKEYLEFYLTRDSQTNLEYISIPIISKVENSN